MSGRRTYMLLVALENARKAQRVLVDVGAATDGPRLHADDLVDVVGWAPSRNADPVIPLEDPFDLRERRWLHVRAAADVGIDVSLSCEEI